MQGREEPSAVGTGAQEAQGRAKIAILSQHVVALLRDEAFYNV